MITCGTREVIQVRIIELITRRNAMVAFSMNNNLRQQAGILDKQILALRTILDMDSIPEINDDMFAWPMWNDERNRTDKGLKL